MLKKNYTAYSVDEPIATDLRLAVFVICFMACVLFAITLSMDYLVQQGIIPLPSWVSIGNAEDARVLLSSIIQSVSTVLGLVFSVVVLVLSMAATQFGPRLLRRFIMDQNGQSTIGLFAATFLFSLFTLVVARAAFVPQLTAITAVILMILAFASLITFSQRIRRGIQTGNLIAWVTEDLSQAIAAHIKLHQSQAQAQETTQTIEHLTKIREDCIKEGYPLLAEGAGYLQRIDYTFLVNATKASDAILVFKVHPGNFIISGTVVAYLFPAEKGPDFIKVLNQALYVGANRTLTQDPEFAFSQIVEIGIRALSAAINDTFTGIACVDWLSNNILALADLPETAGAWYDKQGQVRLFEVTVKFPRLVKAAFDMVRESGAKDPAILIRLLQNFERMGPFFKSDIQRAAIMHQVTAIRELVDMQPATPTDRADILEIYHKACAALQLKRQ